MDERIKETYHKIYAELFTIILAGCCISIIVKLAFFGRNAADCIPEYPILVGSPIYLAIRTRMLGVTQISYQDRKKRKRLLPLFCGLFVAVFVFTAIMRTHGEPMDVLKLAGFMVPFVLTFVLAHTGFRKLEERRQKKLDSKYDD